MNMPLISIILPVYNVEEYLSRCMKSVLNQTYEKLEIILIDDGSTDNSGKLCDMYRMRDKRIKVIHKQNGGLSDARNTGIDIANGEYITCIDSDDYVDLDYVEYLYGLIEKYNTKVSLCSHRIVRENSVIELGNKRVEVLSAKQCLESMCYHKQVDTSAWGKLYHVTLFNDIRYPKGRLFEDIGTTYRLFIKAGFIACGFESKYSYIIRSNSIATSKFSERKLDLLLMTDQMGDIVQKTYFSLKGAVLRRKVYARLSTLRFMQNAIDENKKSYFEIIRFIKSNALVVLKDRHTPIRDKLAVVCVLINPKLFWWMWNKYEKCRK